MLTATSLTGFNATPSIGNYFFAKIYDSIIDTTETNYTVAMGITANYIVIAYATYYAQQSTRIVSITRNSSIPSIAAMSQYGASLGNAPHFASKYSLDNDEIMFSFASGSLYHNRVTKLYANNCTFSTNSLYGFGSAFSNIFREYDTNKMYLFSYGCIYHFEHSGGTFTLTPLDNTSVITTSTGIGASFRCMVPDTVNNCYYALSNTIAAHNIFKYDSTYQYTDRKGMPPFSNELFVHNGKIITTSTDSTNLRPIIFVINGSDLTTTYSAYISGISVNSSKTYYDSNSDSFYILCTHLTNNPSILYLIKCNVINGIVLQKAIKFTITASLDTTTNVNNLLHVDSARKTIYFSVKSSATESCYVLSYTTDLDIVGTFTNPGITIEDFTSSVSVVSDSYSVTASLSLASSTTISTTAGATSTTAITAPEITAVIL